MKLLGRELGNLERAREAGYLDQRNQKREALRSAYERWCWTMKIPIVRVRRRSLGSRFCVVILEMYTTPNTICAEGLEALSNLCGKSSRSESSPVDRTLSPYGCEFGRVSEEGMRKFAREVFRIATTLGYYVPDLALLEARRRKYRQPGQERRRAATA